MICTKCGKTLTDGATFCAFCGERVHAQGISQVSKLNGNESQNTIPAGNGKILYRLTENKKRKYSITVDRSALHITGRFWYLTDKEFVRCKEKAGTGLIRNFIGMGYLAKRSPRTTILFVLAGTVLELIKFIIDKLTELLDKANNYLKWINHEVSLPEWMNNTMNAVAVICILIGIALFFSKKKVIEIAFTDKRICVPEKSMTEQEYGALYRSIVRAKKTIGDLIFFTQNMLLFTALIDKA